MAQPVFDERPRLLIVDDEPKNLRLLANIFSDDYRLSLATSGAKALALLEITPDIELVLLDVMMPEMDGMAVFDALRAHPDRRDLPVVFVTARNDTALEMKALSSGAADYLLKPVHVGLARVRVQQQITLARQRAELERARAAADAGNRAKSQFLTAISHELRTPLNAILGFSQVLQADGNLSAGQHDQVREIREAGTHLLGLINDVLDLGKIEASRMDLTLEAVELGELAGACLRLCEPLSQKQGVALHAMVDSNAPRVWADRTRVRQVIVNLVSNAIKFNREGGQVVLSVQRLPDGSVRVEVKDDGAGIDADLRKRLFEPFVRGAESENRQIEGTGIGLTICKHLVNMMGGQIDCISLPGQGARFWFTLPAAAPVAASAVLPVVASAALPVVAPATRAGAGAAQASSAPVRAPAGVAASGRDDNPVVAAASVARDARRDAPPEHEGHRTILCIDDNPANLKLLQIVLKRLPQVTVVGHSDPKQAVALAAQHRPDLVLLDIQMPDIDGYEVLRRLRALPPLAGMPIAALSANAMAEDIREGLSAGFVAYFTKPFDVQDLLNRVEELLARGPGWIPAAPLSNQGGRTAPDDGTVAQNRLGPRRPPPDIQSTPGSDERCHT